MPAMLEVSKKFDQGEMFLSQVIKSAEVLNNSIKLLKPFFSKVNKKSSKKVLLATVKGDVHDIGKNIVSAILTGHGYQVIDLGVMVEPSTIIKIAKRERVQLIGLSGLISSSLPEMKNSLVAIKNAKLKIPVLVGGAALSDEVVKQQLSSVYPSGVYYVKDAFKVLDVISKM